MSILIAPFYKEKHKQDDLSTKGGDNRMDWKHQKKIDGSQRLTPQVTKSPALNDQVIIIWELSHESCDKKRRKWNTHPLVGQGNGAGE